jgi:hypothetical protein
METTRRSWNDASTGCAILVRGQIVTNENFDARSSYHVARVAHIRCKKDHRKILSATV